MSALPGWLALPPIELVVAMDRRRAIGRDGGLPWQLPDDLRHFRRITMGHVLLMGRRTFQAIGRALPGRLNLVLSRDRNWQAAGTLRVPSLLQACVLVPPGRSLMVIGGGEIYALTLPLANRIHLCQVHTEVESADTWFPDFDAGQWREYSRTHHPRDERHAHAFDQLVLERSSSVAR